MNVVFVKVGNKYTANHVNNLFESLHLYNPDYKYYCLTDSPVDLDRRVIPIVLDKKLHLRGVWAKLFMFSPDFPVEGNILYFDIDTIIRNNPFTIDINWNKLTVVDCHWKPSTIIRVNNYDVTINSSILAWNTDNSLIHNIWRKFNNEYRDYYLRKYVGIDRFLVHEGFADLFDYFPHSYISSYKYFQQPDAPVITFEEVNFERPDFVPLAQSN